MLIKKDSTEYQKMEWFCDMLNFMQDKNMFEVADTYLDLGANLMWTTLVAQGHQYQLLYPPMQRDIILNGKKDEIRCLLFELVEKINERGW